PLPGGTVPVIPSTAQTGATTTAAANAGPDDIIPAGVINFAAVDIQEVLKIYAELVNRTILRPTQLPGVITLRTQTALTKSEAIQALKAVLAMNGVSIIEIGDKFVKVVPTAQAPAAGAAFNTQQAKDLPELGSYVTHVVQLKYVKPTAMVQVLTPFGRDRKSTRLNSSHQIISYAVFC